MKKVLLYSGGMDSWLIDKIWKPDIKIYVDMKTEYSEIEKSRLPADVILAELPLNQFSLDNSIIPLRNAYLYLIACNITGFEDVEICLGALNGDRINDKSLEFINLLNPVVNFLYEEQQSQPGRKVNLVMPFKDMSKRELLDCYLKKGGHLRVAYNNSFSCYHPLADDAPCLNCKACFRKAIPFIVSGMKFNHREKESIIKYVDSYVLSNLDDFTLDKGKEGIDCVEALSIIDSWREELI